MHPVVRDEIKRLVDTGIISPKQIQSDLRLFVEQSFTPLPSQLDKAFYPPYEMIKSLKRKFQVMRAKLLAGHIPESEVNIVS